MYMKRCSNSEQIKTKRRHYFTPVALAKVKNCIMLILDRDTRTQESSCTSGATINWCSHSAKQSECTSSKLSIIYFMIHQFYP